MSIVHVEVGFTGWVRAWVCDRCGLRHERKPTGNRDLAQGYDPEGKPTSEEAWLRFFEYDEERFPGEDHALQGWVSVDRGDRSFNKFSERLPDYHLCPKCAQPLLDQLMTSCREPTSTTEAARNVVELPR